MRTLMPYCSNRASLGSNAHHVPLDSLRVQLASPRLRTNQPGPSTTLPVSLSLTVASLMRGTLVDEGLGEARSPAGEAEALVEGMRVGAPVARRELDALGAGVASRLLGGGHEAPPDAAALGVVRHDHGDDLARGPVAHGSDHTATSGAYPPGRERRRRCMMPDHTIGTREEWQ